ncbi:hypothetical protein DE146DRAFT_648000 [Phaeosphaeria sp. MPI-PUGE-AT-0046c]|nr:hypothetical protein DE146DRAFT_648000 [Phaeosphaeria sp. MPI-PUGE-AT-0046c]
MFGKAAILSALLSAASAGTIVWDGRFNDMTSSADLEKWSFSTPVGSYQYYIHGSGATSKYVNLDSSFKNPADTGSKQGAKITIDETAKWNGQSMLRTELIPQTTAAINKGKLFYHFSVKTTGTNAPTTTNEHQVAFFESHFTELKYGGAANNKLQWHVGGVSKWEVELVADEWHNVAYEIDFDGGQVTFWHSTGSAALTKTAGPFKVSTSSNGADWHLGVLRLPGSNDAAGAEDWFFSGVYIEGGELTTSVDSAGGAGDAVKPVVSSAVAAAPTTMVTRVSSQAVVKTSEAAVAPITSSIPTAAPEKTSVVLASTGSTEAPAATPVTPVATSVAAPVDTPTASPGSGSGSGPVLPEKFTIKQFVAWLKLKQGIN